MGLNTLNPKGAAPQVKTNCTHSATYSLRHPQRANHRSTLRIFENLVTGRNAFLVFDCEEKDEETAGMSL